uniref:Uncharacterized protein n=1 Tax=Globodera rostochiensis TaxID=31243 RepID=A0A914HIR0_GLORO
MGFYQLVLARLGLLGFLSDSVVHRFPLPVGDQQQQQRNETQKSDELALTNQVCANANLNSLCQIRRHLRVFKVREETALPPAKVLLLSSLSHNGVPVHPLQFQRFLRSEEVNDGSVLLLYDVQGWHKVLLSLIIFSQLGAFVAMCTGVCAPCFPPTTFCFAISLFIAMLLSMLADGIFFFYANRVDVRFVTGMVGTYEQVIGYAFYLHMGGTLCWVFAFLCAIATTYKFLTSDGQQRKLFEDGPPLHSAARASVYRRPVVEWSAGSSAGTPQRAAGGGKSAGTLRLIGSNTQV